MRTLIESTDSTVARLLGSVRSLGSASEQLMGDASSSSEEAGRLSATASQVSENVQTVAAGVEEMGSNIKEIAENARQASSVAQSAVDIAQDTVKTVNKLDVTSKEVGSVVKVISSIAEQTNLWRLTRRSRLRGRGKPVRLRLYETKLRNSLKKRPEQPNPLPSRSPQFKPIWMVRLPRLINHVDYPRGK